MVQGPRDTAKRCGSNWEGKPSHRGQAGRTWSLHWECGSRGSIQGLIGKNLDITQGIKNTAKPTNSLGEQLKLRQVWSK